MYDAVVVLANLMDATGRLNNESQSRLSLACEHIRTGTAPILVTCGWAYRDDSDISIAKAMARHAIQNFRLEKSQIIMELNSRDTVGDAVFTKRNFANYYGWNSLLVVTSTYHVDRAHEIFCFVYGKDVDVVGAEGQHNADHAESEVKSLAAFRKTFNRIEAGDDERIYQRLITAHPFYNGDAYQALT